MWRELNVAGVYMPPLLAYMLAALVVYIPLRFLLTRLSFWRWTGNQPLAEVGVYTCVLALLAEVL